MTSTRLTERTPAATAAPLLLLASGLLLLRSGRGGSVAHD